MLKINIKTDKGNKSCCYVEYENKQYTLKGFDARKQKFVIILIKDKNGKIFLHSENWDLNASITRYRNIILGEKKIDTERKIRNNIYNFIKTS